MAAAWVQTLGNLSLRCTGWAPGVPKEIAKVARELPSVGGKGPVPFAPLTGNMVLLVMLHHIAAANEAAGESESNPDVLVFSTGKKGKRKKAPPPPPSA